MREKRRGRQGRCRRASKYMRYWGGGREQEEERNTEGNMEISLGWRKTGVRMWKEMVKFTARSEGNKTYRWWMPAPQDRSKAVPFPMQMEKPAIRLRGTLLQLSQDLGAESTTGPVEWLTVSASPPQGCIGVSVRKSVWRESSVCQCFACFYLWQLFWFLSKIKGEHRRCILFLFSMEYPQDPNSIDKKGFGHFCSLQLSVSPRT